MMSGVALEIQSQELDDLILAAIALGDAITGNDLRLVMGTALTELVREHFYAINADSEHHTSADSLGGKRTGYFADAGDKTHDPQVESDGVSVSIEQEGIAQRYFGGDIEGHPFLTIPARAEAYGHRAGEFGFLKLIKFPSGLYALVDKDEPAHEGEVYYWLARSVHQNDDPSILPTEDEMTSAASSQAASYIEHVWNRDLSA